MAIDERSRHAMYAKLQELMGEEDATVLMEHLPPVGWADVATKRDLDAFQVATKRDLDAFQVATKRDLDALRVQIERNLFEALHQQTRTMVTWLLAAMSVSTVTVGALAFAAARLI